MKRYFLATVLLIATLAINAQQYPFKDGFETTLSGQVPTAYSGDIPVLSYHGVNDLKGLAALLHSGDTEDSITTPLIGPLTQSSILIFYYRWVRDNIYPSEPKMPRKGDKMEIQITTNDTSFTTVHVIDSNNHQPNLNFKRVDIPLGSFMGENVRLKFRCIRGTDRYFMDIDSISVQNEGGFGLSIKEVEENSLRIYPNPCNNFFVAEMNDCIGDYEFTIADITGKTVLQKNATCVESIDVTGLSTGLYVLQANQNSKLSRRKLFIQH